MLGRPPAGLHANSGRFNYWRSASACAPALQALVAVKKRSLQRMLVHSACFISLLLIRIVCQDACCAGSTAGRQAAPAVQRHTRFAATPRPRCATPTTGLRSRHHWQVCWRNIDRQRTQRPATYPHCCPAVVSNRESVTTYEHTHRREHLILAYGVRAAWLLRS